MITDNPFSELSAYISPCVMQILVVLIFLLVLVGTLIDVVHKKSARYFFENLLREEEHKRDLLSVLDAD